MTLRPAGESGLTLVEMLVVLAIIGVAAGATVLGMGAAARGASVEAEAQRLAARLQLAADDAMVADRPVALAWTRDGYGFVAWDGRRWRREGGEGFAPHDLPGGMTLAVFPAGQPIAVMFDGPPISARLVGAAGTWRVVYDGLRARAVAEPRS